MAIINKAQASLGKNFTLGGKNLDKFQIGKSKSNFEKIIFDAAEEFISLAKARIKQKKKVDKGNLSDIEIQAIENKGNKYSLQIGYSSSNPAKNYYDFQNKGVKGLKSGQPNSIYQFNDLGVSNQTIKAIMDWYLRHKNYIKNDDQKYKLSGQQKKSRSIAKIVDATKNLRELATNTAINIRRKGVPRVGFIDDNLDQAFGQDFRAKLATALGQDVALTITQTFKK